MPYPSRNRTGGARAKGTALKLTGMFRGANKDLLSGSIDDERLDELIVKIKAAKKTGTGLVFFLWRNTLGEPGPRTPVFNLQCDVSRPRPAGARPARRPIEPDPMDDDPDDFGRGDSSDDPFSE